MQSLHDWLINFIYNIIRGLGTGEPMFNMQSGRLEASLDRVEAILTHTDADWFGWKRVEENVNKV